MVDNRLGTHQVLHCVGTNSVQGRYRDAYKGPRYVDVERAGSAVEQGAAGYRRLSLMPDHNRVKLRKMRSECAALWGAIESKGRDAGSGIAREISAIAKKHPH